MVAHVGQKQFVHNWNVQPSNANQVLLPIREGLIHLFSGNQQVSLGVTASQRRMSVRRHPCAHTSSRKRRAASSAKVSSTSVDPSDFQCCGFDLLPQRSRSSMGNLEVIEVIPLTAPSKGEKRQSSTALHRADESKQLEATRITQVAIQASRLLTSGLLFGLMGRDQSSGGLGEHCLV